MTSDQRQRLAQRILEEHPHFAELIALWISRGRSGWSASSRIVTIVAVRGDRRGAMTRPGGESLRVRPTTDVLS
jgi:hypothetical protein